ncbi:hypothetical protein SAMN04488516_1017 [Desulfonauticus submarinus]|uniref:Uncharacterized protein n=1 Tax=Desulfonauticus submarinus TaxID=206665 RepID=A0A1G9ZFE3_9BACT|nr:hypothetical protein [Desulfonauticus submarinus]SDN20142.1 hypothetical protein SAMN04488516_1017 [Desulfonauticus submarinus]
MNIREKLESMMVAITFAEANCPNKAKYFLNSKSQKKIKNISKKRVERRATPRVRL